MELSNLQKTIINESNNKTVVIAAAASGKTATLTEKVRQLLLSGVDPSKIAVITFTKMAAGVLRERLGDDYNSGMFIGTIHALANNFLTSYGIYTGDLIEKERFDDFFELLKDNPKAIKKMEWVILDEAQDSNAEQFEFLFDMINPDHFFIVGDFRQCQPAGTQILLRGGETKSIEEINIGDDLVYYDSQNGRCSCLGATTWNSKHSRVKNIAKRKLENEQLITIKTESGKISKYTDNHRTFVKMNEQTEYEHVVYLMSDNNNRFRIGKVPLRGTKSKNGNPWREKMTAEGCTKVWLLKVFKTDKEARVYEQKMSYFYQIPQLCWQTNKVTWNKEDIDYIYEGIDTFSNAKKCLEAHNRNINFPIINKNLEWSFNQKFACNATSQLYACNIMPEFMDCVIYDHSSDNHSHKKFEKIESVEFTKSNEYVYSLETDSETYVADGIITHNCIYEWCGSDPSLLRNIMLGEDVKVFSLNENYRNGSNILMYAKRKLRICGMDDDSRAMKNYNGIVSEAIFSYDYVLSQIKNEEKFNDWAILARSNQDVNDMMTFLKRNGIPCDTFRQGDLTKEQLDEKMEANSVKILTIHSAKGLEWPKVIVMPFNTPAERPEECRLAYVAATRAKDRLVWTSVQPKRYRQRRKEWTEW